MTNNRVMPEPYERLCRVYDAGWSEFTLQYVPFVEGFIRDHGLEQARVLDLACGTGVLALELARLGHTVHGIDSSPGMIRIAREKGAGVPGVTFVIGDMREFRTAQRYDVVTCTYDALNYIRRLPEVKRVIGNVAGALEPGGLFIFDVNTKVLYRHHAGETERREHNGEVFLQESRYNGSYKLATTLFSFADGECEMHQQRPYSYDELRPILERAGFSIVNVFSWFSGIPYSPQAPKVFYVAEKQ